MAFRPFIGGLQKSACGGNRRRSLMAADRFFNAFSCKIMRLSMRNLMPPKVRKVTGCFFSIDQRESMPVMFFASWMNHDGLFQASNLQADESGKRSALYSCFII